MKTLTATVLFIVSLSFLALGILRGTGYVGATEKNGGTGCNCHSSSPTTQVTGWVVGPDSVRVGTSADYRLYLIGGPKVSGGYNLTALRGKVYPSDSFSKLVHFAAGDSQLTHTSPRGFTNDTVFWSFRYVAPAIVGNDTIYSVVNSTNGNAQADGSDRWNFGRKFVVRVHNNPVSVENNNLFASDFILYQNYPNPFNPSTNIKFNLSQTSEVTLKVYDALGNEIKTLVDEVKSAGSYEVQFISDDKLSSGIYFLELSAGNFRQTKKMILLR